MRLMLSAVLCCVLVAGCAKPASHESAAAGPRSFDSPDEAARALYDAASSRDTQGVMSIFGPSAKDFLISGDATQDNAAFAAFTKAYDQMHRWGKLQGDGLVLTVGVDNYPFPFPLRHAASGKWLFDAEGGREEFLARRIGDNELTVMDVMSALADAQAEYFSVPRDGSGAQQYAQRFVSTPGTHDGLYWPGTAGDSESPLGPLLARATAEGYDASSPAPTPFHGYYFRILTEQGQHADGGARSYIVDGRMTGGFAFLAYPAEYRRSGVMTFLVDQSGRILQQDLGPETPDVAPAIRAYDPDPAWSPVE
jgi:hypothetical protein